MLKFDPDKFCIPAESSEVLEVYRSRTSIQLPTESQTSPPLLAFVCILKGARGFQVFAVLHAKEIKRTLVYAVDRESGENKSAETFLEKAFAFTEALGFEMEAINLQYGDAMREVVLKTVPVLMPPETAEKVRQERGAQRAEWEMAINEHKADEKRQQKDIELSVDEQMKQKTARQERAAAAEVALKRVAAEQRNDEQVETARQEVEKILAQVNGPEALDAERERFTAETQAVREQAAELEKRVRHLESQLEALRGESEKRIEELEKARAEARAQAESAGAEQKNLEKAKAFNERRRIELEEELAKAWQEIETGHAERDALIGEKKAAERRIAELEGVAQEAKALAASEEDERDRLEATRVEGEQRLSELQEEKDRVRKELEIVASERERLAEEQAGAAQRIAELEAILQESQKDAVIGVSERKTVAAEQESHKKRIDELEKELNKAQERAGEAELARVKSVNSAERVAELEAALRTARERAEAERLDREVQTREKIAAEQRILQLEKTLQQAQAGANGAELSTATTDMTDNDRIAELEVALRQMEERAEFLRLELEQMAAAKVAAEQRMNELQSVGGAVMRQERETLQDRTPAAAGGKSGPSSSPGKGKTGPPPHVVRRPPPRGAFFHVDWDLTGIEYTSPEDVLEAYRPLGMLQLSIEGYPSQHCSAYIITMKKGKTRQVYVAFFLSESERTLIYVPAKPIRNQAAYAEAIREALKFLEVVGCMPDKIELKGSAPSRAKALCCIPFLTGSSQ